MKITNKFLLLQSIVIILCVLFFVSINTYAQSKFKVKVTVTNASNGKPIANATVKLKSNENFFDTDIKTTDANGVAVLNAQFGGSYQLSATYSCMKREAKTININKYGDSEFSDALALEQDCKDKVSEKLDKEIIITVKGKDNEGNIKLLKDATVFTPSGTMATDKNGVVKFKHGYPLATLIYFAAEADGFLPKEDGVTVGTKPAMIYNPDQLELILDAIPYSTLPFIVTVLDAKTEQPVNEADVVILYKNGQGEIMDNTNIYSDLKGEAHFTEQQSLPFELINKYSLSVKVVKDKYQNYSSDIPKELLIPSKDPRLYTAYIKQEEVETKVEGPGWILESFTLDPDDKWHKWEGVTIADNKITAKVKSSTLTMTINNVPKFIKDRGSYDFYVTMNYEGNDYASLNLSFLARDAFESNVVDGYNAIQTVGKMKQNDKIIRSSKLHIIVTANERERKDQVGLIQPQIFLNDSGEGPLMFRAKYVWRE